ncbi:hypothetical protein [Methylocystis sp.]|uniref:hypothetical protein n=1 Tax=Methylocystis sp. TaxID=1911079 RepID=UPI003D0D956C
MHGLSDIGELYAFACDPRNVPEARLFAEAKVIAGYQLAASSRIERPSVDLELLAAHTAGLNSLHWMDPARFGTILAAPVRPGERHSQDERPPEFRAALEAELERRNGRE